MLCSRYLFVQIEFSKSGVFVHFVLLCANRIYPEKCTVQKRFLAYLFSCTEMPCKEAGRSLALKVVNRFECKFNRCRFTRPSKAPASTAWSRFPDKSSFVKYLRPWKARVRMASILLALRLRLISDTAPSTWLRASEGTCKEQIYCKKTLFFFRKSKNMRALLRLLSWFKGKSLVVSSRYVWILVNKNIYYWEILLWNEFGLVWNATDRNEANILSRFV